MIYHVRVARDATEGAIEHKLIEPPAMVHEALTPPCEARCVANALWDICARQCSKASPLPRIAPKLPPPPSATPGGQVLCKCARGSIHLPPKNLHQIRLWAKPAGRERARNCENSRAQALRRAENRGVNPELDGVNEKGPRRRARPPPPRRRYGQTQRRRHSGEHELRQQRSAARGPPTRTRATADREASPVHKPTMVHS